MYGQKKTNLPTDPKSFFKLKTSQLRKSFIPALFHSNAKFDLFLSRIYYEILFPKNKNNDKTIYSKKVNSLPPFQI